MPSASLAGAVDLLTVRNANFMSDLNEEQEDQRDGAARVSAARPAIASEAAVFLSLSKQYQAKLGRLWMQMAPEDLRRLKLTAVRHHLQLAIDAVESFEPVGAGLGSLRVSVRPALMSLDEQRHRWRRYKDGRWPGLTLDDENDHFREWLDADCPEWKGGGA